MKGGGQVTVLLPQGFLLAEIACGVEDLDCLGESGLDQTEMRSFLCGRFLASQLVLLQGIFDTDTVQEEVSDDRPFPGPGGFALGHAILVVIEKSREV